MASLSHFGTMPKEPVVAIFVHAGAGYHSLLNEKLHLEACNQAARVGMTFLRAGSSATEAVEVAIRCLEENEVTNAGFGSNLNIDGVVECDATIVDHLGRSGACGAAPGIKHPISLAKAILDGSVKPLSLDRPPPNILVGQGAKDYAEKHRIAIVSNRSLTSKSSMERYLRLKHQLKKAEKAEKAEAKSNQNSITVGGHGKAMNATGDGQHWNFSNSTLNGAGNQDQSEFPDTGYLHPVTAAASPGAHGNPLAHTAVDNAPPLSAPVWDGSVTAGGSEEHSADDFGTCEIDGVDATSDKEHGGPSCAEDHRTQLPGSIPDRDAVTDTVGAIAIDIHGNIAAGSSSGGIGMKLRGRLGPAALVGVGTAVVPQDPDDELATTVAAVTSGTGEQMATTLASGKCAERLYRSTRRGPGGQDIREDDEHVVLESFILHDFLGHPGVRSVPSPAAIGVMAVKKDRGSLYFYFAHNTDSFALATMSSLDREPLCVMSRRGDATEVAQGARKIRLQ